MFPKTFYDLYEEVLAFNIFYIRAYIEISDEINKEIQVPVQSHVHADCCVCYVDDYIFCVNIFSLIVSCSKYDTGLLCAYVKIFNDSSKESPCFFLLIPYL